MCQLNMNPVCPICLELFTGRDIVATPCGHVFHSICLAGPCEDSELCPVCKVEISEAKVLHLHFFIGYNESNAVIIPSNDILGLGEKLKEKDAEILLLKKKIRHLKNQILGIKTLCRTVQQKYCDERKSSLLKQRQVELMEIEIKDLSSRHSNFAHAVNQFAELNVRKLIRGTILEAGEALHEQGLFACKVGDEIARNMGMLIYILKYEFDELHAKNEQYLQQLIHKDTQLLELLQTVLELQRRLRNNNERIRDVGFH